MMAPAIAPQRRIIDGSRIRSLDDAYDALVRALDLPKSFGRNLDALWDSATGDVAGPVELVWEGSAQSRAALGEDFDRLLSVLREVEAEREDFRLFLR